MSEMVTVGNIPWHTGDDVLACHFATAGRLISCQIQRHADTLRSKGWAYVRVCLLCCRPSINQPYAPALAPQIQP